MICLIAADDWAVPGTVFNAANALLTTVDTAFCAPGKAPKPVDIEFGNIEVTPPTPTPADVSFPVFCADLTALNAICFKF